MIWNDIKANEDLNLKSYIVELDTALPICFSYLGELNIKKDDIKFNETVCFIIHPYKETTHLIFTAEVDKYHNLVQVFQDLTADKAWELILSTLVYVSDNWLINEDFYADLPPTFKRLIENARCLPLVPTQLTN
ncbi:hypothetical protein ACS126_05990 [Sphingobacterium lactis]|uniref:hypothetical protein n=1 Tax=Sphingobacterium TaxID=28453 RepID=UPI00257B6E25|nr:MULTISPECIES: hypothetical protein [Sphingobacterium]